MERFWDPQVRAAGGVVWRRADDGIEVLLVHRPKYDDWSLPKGKLDRGEESPDAAVREVEEETGYVCTLGPELAGQDYVDHLGRTKSVRYWAMQVEAGDGALLHEVDETAWLPLEEAAERLSYPRDVLVLDSLQQFTREPPG